MRTIALVVSTMLAAGIALAQAPTPTPPPFPEPTPAPTPPPTPAPDSAPPAPAPAPVIPPPEVMPANPDPPVAPSPAPALPAPVPAVPEPLKSLSPQDLEAIGQRLNTMSQQMADGQSRETVFVTVGKAVAAAWVGYAIYALRAGSLLSSFLSIMPLWRSLDLLPIIEASEANLHRIKRRLKSGKRGRNGPDERELGAVI